jgi:putative hydrolase of the HAD superfamily
MMKIILFDVGGVFLDPERSFDGIFEQFAKEIGASPEKMVVLHNEYLDRMLFGKITAAGFFARVKREFKIKGDLETAWTKVAMKNLTLNKELLKITDALRTHYRMALLSNVSQMRSKVDEEFDLYSHFDAIFLSYKLKMQKPSKRIFMHVLKTMKAAPGEILYVDDKESNLKVARELGIKSIQFNNNAQLRTEFERLGLL